MARKVPVSEVANLPFNLSEEDISRGVTSVRRQMEAAGLLPESQPVAASAHCDGDDGFKDVSEEKHNDEK